MSVESRRAMIHMRGRGDKMVGIKCPTGGNNINIIYIMHYNHYVPTVFVL